MKKLGRVLLWIGGVLGILILGLIIFGIFTARNSFPKVNGEISLPGLDGPVDVFRDEFGVPNIYAATEHDLFMAQGYLQAQDRFWQMDVWRHVGSARLSEMFGEAQLDMDKFLRTLGWARVVQKELETIDPEIKGILEAYAEGVNAYLSEHRGSDLSLEYAILKLINSGYQPEPWQPLHTLTWAKAMAWQLGGNADLEIERAVLLNSLTPDQLAELYPPYPPDHPYIVPEFAPTSQSGTPDQDNPAAGAELAQASQATGNIGAYKAVLPDLKALAGNLAALDAWLQEERTDIGSNSWAISGSRTVTGEPLLANDMHLEPQMPSIWYENGLHCIAVSPQCRLDVVGFSFPGTPGVTVGHNARIAWGDTNLDPDVQDLYIEKINPEDPNQYEVNGEWVDMDLVEETIQVAGGEPVKLTVRYTRHGPVISGVYGKLENFDPQSYTQQAGVDVPQPYAIALRWTGFEPTQLFQAIIGFNLASNWEEFRQAAQYFSAPSQNLVYADVDGNIGYQTPGLIPQRANGDGSLPVPGWTDEYEWQGYIPFEQLPFSYNPASGYIVTANNAVIGPDYPHLLTEDWDRGFRARRIVDMIEGAPGPIDSADVQTIHGDNKNLNAERLVPVLLQVPLEEAELDQVRAILEGWDYQDDMESAPAALFAAFWKHLLGLTFQDELPEAYPPNGDDRWMEIIRKLVDQPDSPWWDDQHTAQVEDRDQIFAQAFDRAVTELEETLGKNPERWKWGDLHTLTFENQSLGQSGIGPIEALFNRGPYRTSGGRDIVNATGWNAAKSYEVSGVPSERMIIDLSNLANSLSIHTTGQSGHAYHEHYVDMADLWRNILYHPMLWERQQIEAQSEGHLQLIP